MMIKATVSNLHREFSQKLHDSRFGFAAGCEAVALPRRALVITF